MSEHLESVYPNLVDCNPCAKKEVACDPCSTGSMGSNKFAYFILWWVILVVIIWFIIYSLQPSWAMKQCNRDDNHHGNNQQCQFDQGKAILVSIIISLFLVVIFYLIARSW